MDVVKNISFTNIYLTFIQHSELSQDDEELIQL